MYIYIIGIKYAVRHIRSVGDTRLWPTSQERADKFAGITNQERPLVGVRGEQKDLKRISRLLKRYVGDMYRESTPPRAEP
jgi:hypothetical protein